jgi:hypothetical protein
MINILLFNLITNNLYHYYHKILLWILGLQRDQPGEGRVSGEGEAPGTGIPKYKRLQQQAQVMESAKCRGQGGRPSAAHGI